MCYPEEHGNLPEKRTSFELLSQQHSRFKLSSGAGQQIFVLIASREPLPSYSEWRENVEPFPSVPSDAKHGYVSNGEETRPMLKPRGVEPVPGYASFDTFCKEIKRRSGRTRTYTFSVREEEP